MSKDLSSKEVTNSNTQPNIARASLVSLGTIGLFILGQFLGILLIVAVFMVAGLESDQIDDALSENIYAQFFAIITIASTTLGLLWGWYKYKKQSMLQDVGLNVKPTLQMLYRAVVSYGMYFVTFVAVVLVLPALLPALDVDQAQQLGFDSPAGVELIFVYASLVIIPALSEEIIFRGFLYKRLKSYIQIRPAAIMTSLIFAVAHLEFLSDGPLNWIAAIDTFVLSLFLIRLVEKTNSLWASVFLHGIKNSVAFVILFLL